MKSNETLYELTQEDFQNVASEVLNRRLTSPEIQELADWVAERISWYDLIVEGINELIGNKEENTE